MKILQKKVVRKSKRVGRGDASNKGKTAGRGMNGQRSRSGASTKHISGGQTKLYRQLPKVSTLKPRRGRVTVLSYDYIMANFSKTDSVGYDNIVKKLGKTNVKKIKIISGREKIEKRSIDNTVQLSKTLKSALDNA